MRGSAARAEKSRTFCAHSAQKPAESAADTTKRRALADLRASTALRMTNTTLLAGIRVRKVVTVGAGHPGHLKPQIGRSTDRPKAARDRGSW